MHMQTDIQQKLKGTPMQISVSLSLLSSLFFFKAIFLNLFFFIYLVGCIGSSLLCAGFL